MQIKRFIYATLDNRTDTPNLAAYPAGGINAAPLEVVCYRDIAAVVSDMDIDLLAPSQSDEHHQAHLLKYQQVNAFLLEQSGHNGLLPLKFGFTANNDEEVARVLEHAYVQLRTYLDSLQGKRELVIQVVWELPKILQEIAKENPELASMDPVQAGQQLFESSEVKKGTFVAAIHNKLTPLATDYSDAPLRADGMIFNRSFLVEKDKKPLFDDAVDEVATEFEDVLTFRYIGPLPAYSFVNIELNQGNYAMVDRARQLLQLSEKASWDSIKSAYRQLILAHHPDRNPGDPDAARRAKEIVAAFETVRAYCQSLPGFAEAEGQREFSFTQEAVGQAFIIDDKGALLARGNKPGNPA